MEHIINPILEIMNIKLSLSSKSLTIWVWTSQRGQGLRKGLEVYVGNMQE